MNLQPFYISMKREHSDSIMLREVSWVDLKGEIQDTVAVIPVGSTEQHGPHNPLGTFLVEALRRWLMQCIWPLATIGESWIEHKS